jgi:hypothetical protein
MDNRSRQFELTNVLPFLPLILLAVWVGLRAL